MLHSNIKKKNPAHFVCSRIPWWLREKSACNAGDPSLIPGLGKPPGEENGNPLQYSCLENPVDGGACQAMVFFLAWKTPWTEEKSGGL